MGKKKVGILTLPITTNYGGILQLFALYHTMERLGYDVKYIRRRWNSGNYDTAHKIKRWIYQKIIIRKFKAFENQYLSRSTPIIESHKDYLKICQGFDAVIVGSDQVWRVKNTRGVENDFFLDFKSENIKKIAYAASFGVDYWDEISPSHTNTVRELLKEFSVLTVREYSGVDICRDTFGLAASVVLDPTLLLRKEDYISAFKLKKNIQKCGSKVLGVYILDETPKKNKLIEEFAKNNGLVVRYINKTPMSKFNGVLPVDFTKNSIIGWLVGLYSSDFVLTDSFHGTVFSIIFNKPFYSIDNVERGSTRFKSLFEYLEINGRLIEADINQIKEDWADLDYSKINRRLDELRSESIQYLQGL